MAAEMLNIGMEHHLRLDTAEVYQGREQQASSAIVFG